MCADARKEVEKLAIEVRELKMENESLKAQFEKALKVAEQVDQVFDENERLKRRLVEMQSENDDMKKRLELSVKASDEIREEFAKKPPRVVERLIQTKAPDDSEQLKKEIETCKDLINNLKTENSKLDFEKRKSETELHEVFKICSEYFHQAIESVTDLIPAFASANKHVKSDDETATIAKLKGKIREYKQRLKKEAKRTVESVTREQRKYSQFMRESEDKTSDMTARIRVMDQEAQQLKSLNEDLSQRNQHLTEENASLRAQLRTSSVEAVDHQSQEKLRLTRQIGDLNYKIGELQRVNTEYKMKMKEMATKMQILNKKHKSTKQMLQKTEESKFEIEQERGKVHLVTEQWEKKYNELIEQTEHYKDELVQRNVEIQKLKLSIDEQASEINAQKKMVELTKQENGQIEQILEQQKNVTKAAHEKIQELEAEIVTLNTKLKSIQTELEMARKPVDPAKLLPLASWSCSEFPSELQTVVQDIAENPTLQAPSKLKHVLSVVTRWFLSRSERIESELSDKKQQVVQLSGQIDMIVQFLIKLFPDIDIDFRDILEDEKARSAVESFVKKMRSDVQHLLEMKSSMEEETLETLFLLHVDRMSDAKSAIEKLIAFKSKYRKVKEVSRKQREQLIHNVSMQEKLIEQLNGKIEKMQSENESLLKVVAEKDTIFAEAEKAKEAKFDQYDEICKDLQRQVVEEEDKRKDAEANVAELRDLLTIEEQKNEENGNLLEEIERLKKHYKDKLAKERTTFQTRYEQAIEQMSNKNSDYLETIKMLNQRIEELNKINSEIEAAKTDLSLKLQRLETKSQAAIAESSRDKRLQESQMQAKIMSLEADFQRQLDEEKARSQTSIRQVVELLNQVIPEGGAKITIDNIVDGIRELAASVGRLVSSDAQIRKILRIGPDDSIEKKLSHIKQKLQRYTK